MCTCRNKHGDVATATAVLNITLERRDFFFFLTIRHRTSGNSLFSDTAI